ncbi:MAG: ABC transporter permease [Lachnospiraceae bacterium]|nr:ABC transporter permease [Lachnospiraceae bacterium]
MLLAENIRMALTSLLANKSRALLTMLGIIIGIASVIAIMTVGNSLSSSVSSEMQSVGANNISVYLEVREEEKDDREDGVTFGVLPAGSLTRDDLITAEMLKDLVREYPDLIETIGLESTRLGSGVVEQGKKSYAISVDGISSGYLKTNSIHIVAGQSFGEKEFQEARRVCLIEDKLAKKLFGEEPQQAIGQNIKVVTDTRVLEFGICGVYENSQGQLVSLGAPENFSCFVPLSTANAITHASSYIHFDVVTKLGVDANDATRKIKEFMNGYYRTNKRVRVDAFNLKDMAGSLEKMMSSITMGISIIAGIALLVGGIGVMNIMLVSVTERTREIGTRKALGATNASIRIQFITESMIICLIGGAIGVALGIAGGSLAAKAMEFPARPTLSSILGSLLFSLAIGVFFGFYPANKAAKMNPIEALRYE